MPHPYGSQDQDKEDDYSPSQDSDDERDVRPPQPKRLKVGSPTSAAHTASGRRSNYSDTRSRHSQGRSAASEAFIAKFEIRRIQNAVLKRTMVNNVMTFQLEWSEDMRYADHDANTLMETCDTSHYARDTARPNESRQPGSRLHLRKTSFSSN